MASDVRKVFRCENRLSVKMRMGSPPSAPPPTPSDCIRNQNRVDGDFSGLEGKATSFPVFSLIKITVCFSLNSESNGK